MGQSTTGKWIYVIGTSKSGKGTQRESAAYPLADGPDTLFASTVLPERHALMGKTICQSARLLATFQAQQDL